jgi:hypothetical protein
VSDTAHLEGVAGSKAVETGHENVLRIILT